MLHVRCLLVWVVASLLAAGVTGWALSAVGAHDDVAGLVASVAGVALAGCAVWAWTVCTVVVAGALRGAPGPRGVPAWAARAVLAACGAAALAAAPAHASYDVTHGAADAARPPTPTQAQAQAQATLLDGLPFPDRAVGPAASAAPRPGAAPDPAGIHVVRAGDSLWRIAEGSLGPGASDADVAARAAALLDLNRDLVGPDPDLIHPGLRLRTPGS